MLHMNKFGMELPDSYLQNNFTLGESGDKLTVNKDSDYYKQTANTIINMVTTELGNLRIIKKPIVKASDAPFTDVQQVINTQYQFIILLTKTSILTIAKDNYSLIKRIDGISFDRKKCKASLIENFLLVPQVDGTRKDYELTNVGMIGENLDFKASMRKPIKNKFKVKVDIYQVRKIDIGGGTAELRPYKLTETELQEFTVEGNALKFKYDTDLKITRIYSPYQSQMTNIKSIPGLVENDYFISIFPIETFDEGKYYLGNAELTLNDKTSDKSGTYYKTVTKTGEIGKTGLLNYGTIFGTFQDDFCIVAEYQNRMIVSNGEYIFFSKVGDYNYFTNGESSDDAFYIKLSTVNSEKPKILHIISGRGLWIITNKGVFIAGYNQIITGTNIEVRFISSDRCTLECVDISNTLYYLTEKNSLKAVQNTTGVKGYVDFNVNTVDKFNSTDNISTIDEYIIENRKVLFASLKSINSNEFNADVGAFIYKEEDVNTFSRTSIEIPLKSITSYDTIFIDNSNILIPGTNNLKRAYVSLNVPPTHTKINGYLCNDAASIYKQIALKVVEDTADDIEGVICNGIPSNKLGDSSQGVYSIFKFQSLNGMKLLERIKLTVETVENSSDVELQATEVFYTTGKI